MTKNIFNHKPCGLTKIVMILAIFGFAFIDNNPAVRFQAILGLSPPPLERFFGLKSLFSGMTEGVHRFARLNLAGSVEANIFSPLVIPLFSYFIFKWRVPKIDNKNKEIVFFISFLGLSIIVNVIN